MAEPVVRVEGDEDDQLPKGDWEADGLTPDQIGDSARDLGIDDPSMPPKRESKEGEPDPNKAPDEGGGDQPTPKIKIGEKEYDQSFIQETLDKQANMDAHFTKTNQENAETRRQLQTEVQQATLIRKDLEDRLKTATPKPEDAGPGTHEKAAAGRYEEGSLEFNMARSLDKKDREIAEMRTEISTLGTTQGRMTEAEQDRQDTAVFDGKLSDLHGKMRFAEKVDTPSEVRTLMRNMIINHRETTLENTPKMFERLQGLLQTVYDLGRDNAVKKTSDAPRSGGPKGGGVVTRDLVAQNPKPKTKSAEEEEDEAWDQGTIRGEVKDYMGKLGGN